jgi:hypothetical protein
MKIEFKKGDNVYWQDLPGEVTNIDSKVKSKIEVTFTNGHVVWFTKDGSVFSIELPPVLSHTPYTLNGFTQNIVIEKDTLVWVRDSSDDFWQQRFYSHFKDGSHYCFSNQLTSKETANNEFWNYLETENPLLKKLK